MSQILLKPLEAAISVFFQKSSSIKLYMTCWIHSHQIVYILLQIIYKGQSKKSAISKKKSNVVGCHIYLKKIPYVMLKVTWPHILSNILKHLPTGKPHFKSTGTKHPKLQATCSLKWRGNNTHGWNQGRPSQSSSKTTPPIPTIVGPEVHGV